MGSPDAYGDTPVRAVWRRVTEAITDRANSATAASRTPATPPVYGSAGPTADCWWSA